MSQARADKVMQRELHMNHCFDILLQSIQCSGNLDMIPLVWMYTQAYPFADMYVTVSLPALFLVRSSQRVPGPSTRSATTSTSSPTGAEKTASTWTSTSKS